MQDEGANDGTEVVNKEGTEEDDQHKSSLLSPMNPNLLSVDDLDTDNLAADFDGSFTG